MHPNVSNLPARCKLSYAKAMAASALVGLLTVSSPLYGQHPPVNRKVVLRVNPDYPHELKQAYIGGRVKLEVTVSPNGSVANVTVVGGNPILADSAAKAVKRWKYATSEGWTTLPVAFDFDPRRN